MTDSVYHNHSTWRFLQPPTEMVHETRSISFLSKSSWLGEVKKDACSTAVPLKEYLRHRAINKGTGTTWEKGPETELIRVERISHPASHEVKINKNIDLFSRKSIFPDDKTSDVRQSPANYFAELYDFSCSYQILMIYS